MPRSLAPIFTLPALTGLYLLLPNVVFAMGWTNRGIAVLMLIGMALGLPTFLKSVKTPGLQLRQWFGIAGFAACFTWLGGVGNLVWQRADYLKHALVFGDLTQLSWPVMYGEETGFLCYYLAYYLIPAGLAKVFGAATLPFFSFLWSWAGLSLVGGWLVTIWKKPGWVVLPFFFLLGGWDWLGTIIRAMYEMGVYGQLVFIRWVPLEMWLPSQWNLGHSFPSIINHWSWAPQHALPAWLGGALLVWVSQQPGRFHAWLPWLNALLLLWSPFVALGMFPFVAWVWLKKGGVSWKKWGTACLYVLTIALPILLYFQAHAPLEYAGWVGNYAGELPFWPFLILAFVFWELGPVTLYLGWQLKQGTLSPAWYPLAGLALATVLGLVWFRMGWYNDLVMRGSMVAQLMLFLAFGKAWLDAPRPSLAFRIGLIVVVLGALVPVQEQLKTLFYTYQGTPDFQFAIEENPQLQLPDLDQAYRLAGIPQPFVLATQYLGRDDSFFARYLMRRPDSISTQY